MTIAARVSVLPVKVNITADRIAMILSNLIQENCTQYPWSSSVHGYIRARDWPRLYEWSDRATTVVYGTAAEHFAANQIAALILKAPLQHTDFGFTITPKQRAIDKFVAAEESCRLSNERFRDFNKGEGAPLLRMQCAYARSWIAHVLGDKPDYGDIWSKCNFGPGAALGVHGNATNLYRKFFSEEWSVTPSARPYVIPAVCSNEHFLESLWPSENGFSCYDVQHVRDVIAGKLNVVSCNKVSFVPKTAKVERPIAVEPLLNSYLQHGVDRFMRARLLSQGYNLADQTRNGWLAKVGSTDGSLATLDLSSASDSVSIGLCRYLLPPDWFEFLDAIRSPSYMIDGVKNRYHKFVSMGNGFCFPLETLIFASAVRAVLHSSEVATRTHAVYGDDIIVPTECYEALSNLLEFMGFTLNQSKSFSTGVFRESCGADWYLGQDVRPVYLDYPLLTTSQLMIFHNATLRSERSRVFFMGIRDLLRDWSPPFERLLRPRFGLKTKVQHIIDKTESLLDRYLTALEIQNLNGAFEVEMDQFMGCKSARWDAASQRWTWKEFSYVPVTDRAEGDSFLLAQYWCFLLGSPGGDIYLRRKTRRLTIVR